MTSTTRPRILVVDDEEAILETMAFTFEDDYEVFTSSDARRGLEILDEKAPVSVVLTDQRMPNMSGVEFVTEVCKRHPATVRMILTGFSDMDAIIQAINDGHVYAYIPKPWEPDQLKQLMKQAVEHYDLTVENERLVAELQHANLFLETVMDELDTGALALDAAGLVQGVNRPARAYLALEGDIKGRSLDDVLRSHGLEQVGAAAVEIEGDEEVSYADVEFSVGSQPHRVRITTRSLTDPSGATFGRVILFREISHEPLQRRFNEAITSIVQTEGELRSELAEARVQLRELSGELESSRVTSPGMNELSERLLRTLTAVDNWLDVDDAMAREDYPDAQLLQDRMRVALDRWPLTDEVPERVRELSRAVEDYYESGENRKQHVL